MVTVFVAWQCSPLQQGLHLSAATYLLIFTASYVAGAVNAVASGGTILTFSMLVAVGVPPLVANATNTMALVPGSLTAAYGFRGNFRKVWRKALVLCLPTLIGGILGAQLAIAGGDELFAKITPWLILGSTVLLLIQEWDAHRKRRSRQLAAKCAEELLSSSAVYAFRSPRWFSFVAGLKVWCVAVPLMLLISIYGGYFGPGMGFLTLALLTLIGLTNIHQMLGVKNLISAIINLSAGIVFIAAGRVDWFLTMFMTVGVIMGASTGAHLALKLGQSHLRHVIIAIGLLVTYWLIIRP
jgi:uncharacterized membrane protein YfcA